MERCLIVAIADNLAIGIGGDLPWHIREDLQFFRRTTMGCPVIMGRATWESIGRPLPGRRNIVLTRSGASFNGAETASSLEQAFNMLEGDGRCFVLGGAKVYAQAMDLVDRMFITHVHTSIDNADAFFPAFDASGWEVVSRSEMHQDPETGYDFEFVEYRRK